MGLGYKEISLKDINWIITFIITVYVPASFILPLPRHVTSQVGSEVEKVIPSSIREFVCFIQIFESEELQT